jgi:hypothetical protein
MKQEEVVKALCALDTWGDTYSPPGSDRRAVLEPDGRLLIQQKRREGERWFGLGVTTCLEKAAETLLEEDA